MARLSPAWIALAFVMGCSASGSGSDERGALDAAVPERSQSASASMPTRVVTADGNSAGNAPGNAAGDIPGDAHGDAPVTDSLLATADVYAGWKSFNVNCQTCHGFNAVGSDVAPDLRNSVGKGGTVTHAAFREIVRKGRLGKGMPAWGELLDRAQIDAIYAYLLARSSGSLGAGQPHLGGG